MAELIEQALKEKNNGRYRNRTTTQVKGEEHMSREDIEEAIEVLEDASAEMLTETGEENYYCEAIAILRQALETKQKTAVSPDGGTGFIDGVWYGPPQRKPLTDEQIIKHFQEHVDTGSLLSFADGVRFAEAAHVEAKLKEKNHG